MISLYYGGLFLPGFIIDLILLIVVLKSIFMCYTNKKALFEFIWFWLFTFVLTVSIFNYGVIHNITMFFIYFTITPILILMYGIYIIQKYEKE